MGPYYNLSDGLLYDEQHEGSTFFHEVAIEEFEVIGTDGESVILSIQEIERMLSFAKHINSYSE